MSQQAARRRFRRASTLGTAAGLLVCTWLATFASFDVFEWRWSSDFYDAQAHAWLDGTWEIGIDTLGLEAFYRFDDDAVRYLEEEWRQSIDLLAVEEFFRDQPAYMYQGPVPAVLHLPFAAVTDELDGRLAVLSILVAAWVVGWTSGRIGWEARELLRPDRPMSRAEAVSVGLVTFAVVGGSILTYLASRSWVYHEALLWGVAFCLLSVLGMIRYVRVPTVARLSGAGAAMVLAFLTRASIGVGPLVALALLAAAMVVARVTRSWTRWRLPHRVATAVAPGTAPVAAHALALAGWCLAAVGGYAWVNIVKFHSAFSVPFEWQYFALVDEERRDFLVETGGYFSASFVPTTVAHYLRPDGVRLVGSFPFVDFPAVPGPVVGDVDFDFIDRTSSIPSTLLVFCALAVVLGVVLVRRRELRRPAAALVIPVLAAAGAACTILPFGYIANRYIGDAAPLLVVLGVVGLQALLVLLDHGSGRTRRASVGVLVILVGLGTWVNVGQGLLMQRVYSPVDDEEDTAQLVGWQDSVDRAIGSGDAVPRRLRRDDALPPGDEGDLVVVGDCEALYLNDGNPTDALRDLSWIPVERSAAAGRRPFRLELDAQPVGARLPLATAVGPDGPTTLVLEIADGDAAVVELRSPTFISRSAEFDLAAGDAHEVVLAADPLLGVLSLDVGGIQVFTTYYDQPGPLVLGRDVTDSADLAPDIGGLVVEHEGDDMSLCRDLSRRAQDLDQSAAGSRRSSNRYW